MRGYLWRLAVSTGMLMLGLGCGWAQTRIASITLQPYGAMTSQELLESHPDPDRNGWMATGPPTGVNWVGGSTVAIGRQGRVYVGLAIWASGDAPVNAIRGTGDKLRLLVLNAEDNGRLVQKIDFPARSLDRLDLRIAGDGTLLVVANDKLMRIGSDCRPTSELPLPNVRKRFDLWYLQSSATGRTLRARLSDTRVFLVDTKTLKLLSDCHETSDRNDFGTLTDDMELDSRLETPFPKTTYGLETEVFCRKGQRLSQFGNVDFVPLAVDDSHFLAITTHSLALRKLSGETVWTRSAPLGRELEKSAEYQKLNRDGTRVAVRILRPVLYREPVRMERKPPVTTLLRPVQFSRFGEPRTRIVMVDDTIDVRDVASGRLIARVPTQDPEGRFFQPYSQFALGPNGRLLAVIQDGNLTLWKLP